MRKELSETELAYFAGFIDGEGSFRVRESTPSLRVANTYLPVLKRLQEAFGGGIYNKRQRDPERHRNTFVWEANGVTARDACIALIPFLIEKKPQAQLIAEFYSLSAKEKRVSEIPQQLKELKKIEHPKLSRPISNPANVQQTKARRQLRGVARDRRSRYQSPKMALGASKRQRSSIRTGVRARAA